MAPKRHKHLSHHHLVDTKTSTCLKQNIRKCLLCLHKKLAIITYPPQNTLLDKKNLQSFQNVGTRTPSLTLRPRHISHLTPLLIKNDSTPHLKHCKHHFPPPTITPATMYVPFFSINPHTLLHTPPLSVNIMFSWALIIDLNTIFISSTMSTVFYSSV